MLSRKRKRYKGETIIRIRIRTPIIRIRTADTRILRIIRISSREELPETTATAFLTESRNACYGDWLWPCTAQGGALGGLFIWYIFESLFILLCWQVFKRPRNPKFQGTGGNHNTHA